MTTPTQKLKDHSTELRDELLSKRPATPLEPSVIASAEETIRRAMDKQAHNSATCPICRAKVIVWKRDGLKASLLRALAIANHVKTLHPTIAR